MQIANCKLQIGLAAGVAVLSVAGVQTKPVPKQAGPTFEKEIRQLFVAQCVGCHNRTTVGNPALSGGLSLDSYAAIMKPATGKPVVLPGKPAESELIARLETTDTGKRMPKGGEPLPKPKIDLVKSWIAAGAPRGNPGKSADSSLAPPTLPPGPVLPVLLPVNLSLPADVIPTGSPKDARPYISMMVGPLPPATALAFSSDGRILAVGTYRAVFLWDLTAGKPVRVLTDPIGAVQSLAYTADGTRLAAAGGQPGSLGEVRLYDVKADYKPLPLLTGHTDVVYSLSFNKEGTRLATASHDKTVRIWDTSNGKSLVTIKSHSDIVYQVRFLPDGKSVVSCAQDRSVRQFNAADGTLIRSFEGHGAAVTALAVTIDGKYVLSSGLEPRIRWWNLSDGQTVRFSDAHGAQVNDIAFSPDGKVMASAGADKYVRIWDGNNGGNQKNFDTTDWQYRVAVSPDDKTVAGAGADGVVRIWDLQTGELRSHLLARSLDKGYEYAVVARNGYVSASSIWAKKLGIRLGELPVKKRSADLLAVLISDEKALKLLHGEKVDGPALPNPPAPPKPAGK